MTPQREQAIIEQLEDLPASRFTAADLIQFHEAYCLRAGWDHDWLEEMVSKLNLK